MFTFQATESLLGDPVILERILARGPKCDRLPSFLDDGRNAFALPARERLHRDAVLETHLAVGLRSTFEDCFQNRLQGLVDVRLRQVLVSFAETFDPPFHLGQSRVDRDPKRTRSSAMKRLHRADPSKLSLRGAAVRLGNGRANAVILGVEIFPIREADLIDRSSCQLVDRHAVFLRADLHGCVVGAVHISHQEDQPLWIVTMILACVNRANDSRPLLFPVLPAPLVATAHVVPHLAAWRAQLAHKRDTRDHETEPVVPIGSFGRGAIS